MRLPLVSAEIPLPPGRKPSLKPLIELNVPSLCFNSPSSLSITVMSHLRCDHLFLRPSFKTVEPYEAEDSVLSTAVFPRPGISQGNTPLIPRLMSGRLQSTLVKLGPGSQTPAARPDFTRRPHARRPHNHRAAEAPDGYCGAVPRVHPGILKQTPQPHRGM